MPATLVGPAPGGHFLQYAAQGTLACDDTDPILLVPFQEGDILYRFGDIHHDNAMCLGPCLQSIENNGRNPMTNVAYTKEELGVWEQLSHFISDRQTTNWHATALEAIQAQYAVKEAWDGHTLLWPDNIPTVSPLTPMVGGYLGLCKELVIPAGVQIIDDNACAFNKQLTKVSFAPDAQLRQIRDFAFTGTRIAVIDIPASVYLIGAHAFANSPLREITLSNAGLHYLGANAFASTYLKSILLPATLDILEPQTFMHCRHLARVQFAKGTNLTEIRAQAFANSGIKTICIPAPVQCIGDDAFYHCTQLHSVSFAKQSVLEKIGIGAFQHTDIKSLRCPASLKSIGDEAFAKCLKLKHATLPEQLQQLGKRVFMSTKLESIALPDTLTIVPESAFYGCTYLKRVWLGTALEDIQDEAFYRSGIQEIVMPASVKTIGSRVFNSCRQLTTVVFAEEGRLRTIGTHAFSGTALIAVVFPASVKRLGSRCFAHNKSLVSVRFAPQSKLEKMDEGVFYCTGVDKVYGVPAGVKTNSTGVSVVAEYCT